MRIDFLDVLGLPRSARWVLDLVALLVVASIAVVLWPRAAAPVGVDLGPLPWWGGARDLLLEGPDAGEWSRNMRLMAQGQLDQLDHHRMPTLLLLVAGTMKVLPDVVVAGHFVNRLLYLCLGFSCYGLGRLRGGRVVGLLAAACALALPHALASSQRFGVDMAVTAVIPLVMLGALAAARWTVAALPAGVLAGLVAGVHYTTPPYLLPPILLLILCSGSLGRRVLRLVLFVGGAALAVSALLQVYPVPSWDLFVGDVANGISPGSPGANGQATLDGALSSVLADLSGNLSRSTSWAVDAVRISWVPWPLMVALPWAGVLGLGLAVPTPGTGSWWRALLSRTDLAVGLSLLACLAPLPVLIGVGAPARYSENLLGVVVVLAARGMGSMVAVLDAVLRTVWARWPRGPLVLVVGAVLVPVVVQAHPDKRSLPAPQAQELGTVLLGRALQQSFAVGDGVASPIRESLVLADLSFCPQRVCPTSASVDQFERCLRVLAQDCAGTGPIGYVTTTAVSFYDPNAKRLEMDAWVAEHWQPVQTVRYLDFEASIYQIERPAMAADEDPLAGQDLPQQAMDGSQPPPQPPPQPSPQPSPQPAPQPAPQPDPQGQGVATP